MDDACVCYETTVDYFFFFFSYFWRSPFSNSCFLFSVSVDHIFLFVVVVDYLFTFCHVYYSNPRWPFFFLSIQFSFSFFRFLFGCCCCWTDAPWCCSTHARIVRLTLSIRRVKRWRQWRFRPMASTWWRANAVTSRRSAFGICPIGARWLNLLVTNLASFAR